MTGLLRSAGTRRAMLILGLGTLVITLQDPIIKATMGTYPVAEAVAIRSVVALPIFFVLLNRLGGWRVALEGNTRQSIIRALLFMVAYTTYFLAFPAMPLASVVALYFTAPLFVVLLSRPYLGERQSLSRWIAVLVGFAGAVVVAQPGTGGIGWAALLPVSAAALYAFGQLMARRYGEGTPATVMSFHQNSVYLVGAMLFSFIAMPFATTSAPAKPISTAIQRLALWCSPRYGRDNSTTNSGAVKYRATTSASGMAGNAKKYVV
ncbi:MAG: EamA family transporter [Thermoleophilia bacterium]